MSPLLEQFLSEAREFLQDIGEKLMQLEHAPDDPALINELFRLVHTLKGNSGLFDFPEMSRVLHAGEDLMDGVRHGRVAYSNLLADQLLDAMDFVGRLCDDIEAERHIDASRATDSAGLAEALRALIPHPDAKAVSLAAAPNAISRDVEWTLADVPDAVRAQINQLAHKGATAHRITYVPAEDCFFQGDDPFHKARQTPGFLWGRIVPREAWPPLAELDAYRCILDFHLLSSASQEEIAEHYRYVPDQVRITPLAPAEALSLQGGSGNADAPLPTHEGKGASCEPPSVIQTLPMEDAAAIAAIFAVQRQILQLTEQPAWRGGRLKAVAEVLINCSQAAGDASARADIEAALAQAQGTDGNAPLLAWLDAYTEKSGATSAGGQQAATQTQITASTGTTSVSESSSVVAAEEGPKFGRRAEDVHAGSKSLKVDQAKIDRLMNLIGEMVVSKNALPYLAQRAEEHFGARELAREIKSQYAVINRIAEEMQDAIMQVRMLPVSFVFQRFPRLVRDISRKLGKEVQLVLEGEETEADKNIIESLADPLIHIIRNSLDHGLEAPEVRRACGKSACGTLTIRAAQEADRVLIEIRDDGKGIDPFHMKHKAYEKGIIDEGMLERISDRDAINLVFGAGFSTAEVVSDLSGRGVGMDAVRSAVDKVNGTIILESEVGKGTCIRISLPLSMAVTQVMIVESDGQFFGIPMEHVIETVRVASRAIHSIKRNQTTVLRQRIVPLKALNTLLGLTAKPLPNADDELAVLVARAGGDVVGLLVDNFREAVAVIQKPLGGVLAGLPAYSGSALMGDGSVLMVLNIKEML